MEEVLDTFSIFAAQYLNSGIFPKGSNFGFVNTLAGASLKAKGKNI